MKYNNQALNPKLGDVELIPNVADIDKETSTRGEKIKAHALRRKIEDYLAHKALERSLKEVFEDDYKLD